MNVHLLQTIPDCIEKFERVQLSVNSQNVPENLGKCISL